MKEDGTLLSTFFLFCFFSCMRANAKQASKYWWWNQNWKLSWCFLLKHPPSASHPSPPPHLPTFTPPTPSQPATSTIVYDVINSVWELAYTLTRGNFLIRFKILITDWIQRFLKAQALCDCVLVSVFLIISLFVCLFVCFYQFYIILYLIPPTRNKKAWTDTDSDISKEEFC